MPVSVHVPPNEGVSPDRQKVMIAGMTLLDDDWGKALGKIKDVRNSTAADIMDN